MESKIVWLRRYLAAVAEGEQLLEELEKWRSLAEKTTPTLSALPAGAGGPGQMVVAVEHMEALRAELAAQLAQCAAIRRQIEAAIGTLENSQHRQLLRLRYVEGLTFEAAALRMHYCQRQIYRIHRQAVEQLAMQAP